MIEITHPDLNDPAQAGTFAALFSEYAGQPVDRVGQYLIGQLRRRLNILVFLVTSDHVPAGFAICVEGFSSYACMPLLNIHDFYVSSNFRGRGIGKALMIEIEGAARRQGCCKITLEVRESNQIARNLYRTAGFDGDLDGDEQGKALVMQKKLLDTPNFW